MQKIISLVIPLLISFSSFSQIDSAVYSPVQTRYSFNWGNNITSILLIQFGQKNDIVMIHPHDDETTSLKAAQKVLERTGGLLIELENKGKRLMSFKKSGRRFFFDPNRIFTSRGIQNNLHFLNNQVTSAAFSSVKAFAAFILQKIPDSVKILIALHNNKNGKYSIKSYKPNGSHAKDVSKVYMNHKEDPDNFFVETSGKLFYKLKKEKYNVVLQNSTRAMDDGSLSIYFAKRKIVYVNVEAEKGSLQEQVKMVQSLIGIIRVSQM